MNTNEPSLPHHRLIAYAVAKELLVAVVGTTIRDAELRDQATRAAKSAVLNVAALLGVARAEASAEVNAIAHRLCAMLTRLCR